MAIPQWAQQAGNELLWRQNNDNLLDGDYLIQRMYGPGSYSGEGNFDAGPVTGYRRYLRQDGPYGSVGDTRRYNGVEYEQFDPNFQSQGKGTWNDLGDAMTPMQGLGMIGLAALGGYGLSELGAGAAAGAGQVGGAGGFIGEGALSGIPAWDGALAGAVPGMGAGAGSGLVQMDLGVPPLDSTPLQSLPAPRMELPLPAGAGGLLSGANGAQNATQAAGNLLSPGSLAAGALGAIAGSQPQEASQTQSREPWRELVPYLTGQNGLLPMVGNTMNQQQPLALQAADQLRGVGAGLLNTPMRGNGFDALTRRAY